MRQFATSYVPTALDLPTIFAMEVAEKMVTFDTIFWRLVELYPMYILGISKTPHHNSTQSNPM
jgi:hypothetical protein